MNHGPDDSSRNEFRRDKISLRKRNARQILPEIARVVQALQVSYFLLKKKLKKKKTEKMKRRIKRAKRTLKYSHYIGRAD